MERYIKELKDRQMLLNSELETFQQGELRNLRLEMCLYIVNSETFSMYVILQSRAQNILGIYKGIVQTFQTSCKALSSY